LSADDLLLGAPCLVCGCVPYASESQLAALCRHQEGLIDRLVQSGLERDLEHHADLDRIEAQDEIIERQNRRIQELQAECDRLRSQRRSA
jgi:hypothetical protein